MKRLLTLLVFAFFALNAYADPFTTEEKRVVSCAQERLYILYQFLDPKIPAASKSYTLPKECGGTDKPVTPPEWLLKELPQMGERAVVYNQADKRTETEVDVWLSTIANILEFLKNTNGLLESQTVALPEKLTEQFMKNKANFLISIDRLNTPVPVGKQYYTMANTFQGRARNIIPALELINKEMESAVASFSGLASEREDKFRRAAYAVGLLSNNVYGQFYKEPLPLFPDPKSYENLKKPFYFAYMLMGVGAFVIFFGVFYYVTEMENEISASIQRYLKRSNQWAEDFNRQFIAINVKYLVVGTVIMFMCLGALFGFAMGGFMGLFAFCLVTFMGIYFGKSVPGIVLRQIKLYRGRKISAQLMDSLILLSNALKAGMDVVQGFERVSKDMKPPIADEFALVIKNYQLGASFEAALEGMEDRIENRLLSYMVKAIILQRQVGGNLTKIFERIVETIREESKLEEKLQSMTAQQRIQSIVVSIMPWLMAGVMFLFKPDAMINFYTTPLGFFVLLFSIIWIMIGMKMISKIGEIKV